MDDLKELYQQVILDHNKNPQNFGRLESANRTAEGYNPLCGDRVQIFLQVEDGVIQDLRFWGSGCAISKASASVMTTELKGKTIVEAEELFKKFQSLLTSDIHDSVDAKNFGKLAVFSGVREFPMRIKCASLSWHAMMSALHKSGKEVSTEA
jgi:nitrogen fixation NifU-like protein